MRGRRFYLEQSLSKNKCLGLTEDYKNYILIYHFEVQKMLIIHLSFNLIQISFR